MTITNVEKVNTYNVFFYGLLSLYGLLVLFSALDSYTFFHVPFPWIAKALCFILLVPVFKQLKLFNFPYFKLFLIIIAWSICITVYNYFQFDPSRLKNIELSTKFHVFITLRVFNWIAILTLIGVTYYLLKQGYKEVILKMLVLIGVFIALFAIYNYVASVFGFFEPIRNRMGTAGGMQATVFWAGKGSYHRALGSFREPSFLAMWLIAPLFFASSIKSRLADVAFFVIALAMIMSWSLGIILTVVATILFGFIVLFVKKISSKEFLVSKEQYKKLGKIIGLFVIAFIIAHSIELMVQHLSHKKVATQHVVKASTEIKSRTVKVNNPQAAILNNQSKSALPKNNAITAQPAPMSGLFIFNDRLFKLFQGGILKSNRGYVVQHALSHPPSVFGWGLGISNIILTNNLEQDNILHLLAQVPKQKIFPPQGFLGLYFNLLYSLGWIGLLLILFIFFNPFVKLMIHAFQEKNFKALWENKLCLLMAYASWAVLFFAYSEELNVMFAIIFSLIVYETSKSRNVLYRPI